MALREAATIFGASFDISLGNRARYPRYAASVASATRNELDGGVATALLYPTLHRLPVAAKAGSFHVTGAFVRILPGV